MRHSSSASRLSLVRFCSASCPFPCILWPNTVRPRRQLPSASMRSWSFTATPRRFLRLDERQGEPEVIATSRREPLRRRRDEALAALEQTLYDEMLSRIKQTDLSVPTACADTITTRAPRRQAVFDLLPQGGFARRARTGAARRQRPRRTVTVLGARRDGRERRFADAGLDDRRHGLPPVHSADQGPAHRRRAASLPRARHVGGLGGRQPYALLHDEDAKTKRSNRLWRMRLGESTDTPLYEEPDARFSIYLDRTRSLAYVLLSIGSLTSSEVRLLRADQPDGTFGVLEPRRPDIEYEVDHRGNEFWIR